MRRDLRHENDAPKNKNKESEKGLFFLKYPDIWRPYPNRRTALNAQLYTNATDGANVMTINNFIDVDTNVMSTTFEAIKTSSFVLFKDGSVGACGGNNFGQLEGQRE